jgi:hypothetical protein
MLLALATAALAFAPPHATPARGAAAARGGVQMAHALIVQNKGGGHGEIGFHLAKALRAKGVEVTLLQDQAAKKAKPPFARYETELADCNVAWCDPKDPAALAAALAGKPPLTHIFENNAKASARGGTMRRTRAASGWQGVERACTRDTTSVGGATRPRAPATACMARERDGERVAGLSAGAG